MDILLKNFKYLTTTPKNVEQLKKLVLQLAVQGKLTAQWRKDNPGVEPATVLLEKIKAKKEQFIKEGKIKREKPLPKIAEVEIPFKLPKSWITIRLGAICSKIGSGSTPKGSNYTVSGKPFFRSQNIYNSGLVYDDIKYISDTIQVKMKGTIVKPNDILLNITGGSMGRCALVPLDFDEGNVSQHVAIIRPLNIDNSFFHKFSISPYFQNLIFSSTTGAGREGLPKYNLEQFCVFLPPLAEQKAIVSKVESLFEQIDHLHALAQKKIKYRENTAKALFSKINTASDNTELQETWQLLNSNFKPLTQSKESVKQLRQSILQLAVQGKLTANWRESRKLSGPDIEPARVLLGKIKAEKEQLIKEGKIRREKPLPKISEDEKPFDLPVNWACERFQSLTSVITCGIASTPKYQSSGRMFLSAKNVKPYRFMPAAHKYVDEQTYQSIIKNSKPEIYDILLTRVGAGIGEAAIIDLDIDFAFYVSLTLIKPIFSKEFSPYILHFLNSPMGILNAITYTSGKSSSQGNLNVNRVRGFVIPVPPFEEQKQIVSKVNQLMAWCDELEKKIEKRNAYQERIMQAVVKQAI